MAVDRPNRKCRGETLKRKTNQWDSVRASSCYRALSSKAWPTLQPIYHTSALEHQIFKMIATDELEVICIDTVTVKHNTVQYMTDCL